VKKKSKDALVGVFVVVVRRHREEMRIEIRLVVKTL